MQLNNQIPGFPEWPPIRFVEDKNEYIVGGPHVSYRRYVLARWLGYFLVLAYIPFAFLIDAIIDSEHYVFIYIALLIPLLLVMTFCPATWLLCRWFFPCRKLVRFTPQHIVINKQKYDNTAGVTVQFRAIDSPLSDDAYNQIADRQGELTKTITYELKFRKVEMIYGARIVNITSLADEHRAAKFAIALQLANELARSPKAASSQKISKELAATEDALPE